MNHNLGALLKIRLISQLKLNKTAIKKGDKNARKQLVVTLSVIIVIFAGGIYSASVAYGLELMDLGQFIPAYGFILASLFSLFFTIFKANGELFGFKDYDILMSLPIKTSTVIASRFMYLYLWNMLFTIIIMIPMGFVYAINERPSMVFYPLWLISLFFISLIPTTLATVIGALVTAIASKSRYSSLISTLLTFFLIIVLFSSLFLFGGLKQTLNVNQFDEMYQFIFNKFFVVYPVTQLYQYALIDNNILCFILFIGLSIGWYYVFIKVLSLKYKAINTGLTSFSGRSAYKIHHLKSSPILVTLYKKELKRLLSSTVYVTNTGMGVILSLIASISLLLIDSNQIGNSIGVLQLDLILPKVAPFLLAALISMSCTSCVSLSFEGKNVWLIQTLPVSLKDVYLSKILVNLTFTIPTSMICGCLLIMGTKANLFQGIMLIAFPLTFALFTAIEGLVINYRFVNYDWETETQVVKQSITSMLGILEGFVLAVILSVPALFLNSGFYFSYCLFVIVLLLFLSCVLYKRQIKKAI